MSLGARRRLILEAAERLFQHYGPFKTTVADIAREAHVGVGSVYLEFTSKNAILAALATRGFEHVLMRIEDAWTAEDGGFDTRLRRALDARFEAFLAVARAGTHAPDLLGACCPPVVEARRRFHDAEHMRFSLYLRQGTAAGAFAITDPERAARALLAAYQAFSPPAVFSRAPEEVASDLDALHSLVLRGVCAR